MYQTSCVVRNSKILSKPCIGCFGSSRDTSIKVPHFPTWWTQSETLHKSKVDFLEQNPHLLWYQKQFLIDKYSSSWFSRWIHLGPWDALHIDICTLHCVTAVWWLSLFSMRGTVWRLCGDCHCSQWEVLCDGCVVTVTVLNERYWWSH